MCIIVLMDGDEKSFTEDFIKDVEATAVAQEPKRRLDLGSKIIIGVSLILMLGATVTTVVIGSGGPSVEGRREERRNSSVVIGALLAGSWRCREGYYRTEDEAFGVVEFYYFDYDSTDFGVKYSFGENNSFTFQLDPESDLIEGTYWIHDILSEDAWRMSFGERYSNIWQLSTILVRPLDSGNQFELAGQMEGSGTLRCERE